MAIVASVIAPSFCGFGGATAGPNPGPNLGKADFHRPKSIPFPPGNPYTEAKDRLGRKLFLDPVLSGSGQRSCASCHIPELSWSDGLARAMGLGGKPLPLRTPTLLNIAWVPVPGWHGKFQDLEDVAFTPITSARLMNRKEEDLIAALSAIPAYSRLFADAFPHGAISRRNIELALATFQRTIVSGIAPFDRWIEGDESAIDEAAKRGFELFKGKAQCAECHKGWVFTDASFYDIGTAQKDDIGRAKIYPNSIKLRYAFKTPTLRNVALRAPYMHDGSVATLEATIDLYDRGGVKRPSQSELIKPLHLTTQEKAELVAFLKTLTETEWSPSKPAPSQPSTASSR